MWNLKYTINELIYKIETDIEKSLVVPRGRVVQDGLGVWG